MARTVYGGCALARTLPNSTDRETNAVLGKLAWDNDPCQLRLKGEWPETEIDTHVLSGLGPFFRFEPTAAWNVDRLEASDITTRGRASADWT